MEVTGPVTSVTGTVTGLVGRDLWLDIQSATESAHHPTEQPCQINGEMFSFTTLYVGTAKDRGRRFLIRVLAVPRGGPAEQALIDYAHRDKTAAHPYVGLARLPEGIQVLNEVDVTRT